MSYKWWRKLPDIILKKIPMQNDFALPACEEHMVKIVDVTSETGILLAICLNLSRRFYVKELDEMLVIAKVDYKKSGFNDPVLEREKYNESLYDAIINKTVEDALKYKTYIKGCNIYLPVSEELEKMFLKLTGG